MNTIPFTKKDIKNYLDIKIQSWRKIKKIREYEGLNQADSSANDRIDTMQSIRKDLFGEYLK